MSATVSEFYFYESLKLNLVLSYFTVFIIYGLSLVIKSVELHQKKFKVRF